MPWRIKWRVKGAPNSDEALYWSREQGWVSKDLADVIPDTDYDNARLSLPEDAEWELSEDP